MGPPTGFDLGGDLPCASCRYNLRGLSVRVGCPECGLPVGTTILTRVDPLAEELTPLSRPKLLASALLGWSGFAVAGGVAIAIARLADLLHMFDVTARAPWAIPVAMGLLLLSGVCALGLIRPHSRVPRRLTALAVLGGLGYVPLLLTMWWIDSQIDRTIPGGFLSSDGPEPVRSVLRLIWAAAAGMILLGLRPVARLLSYRSHLMRSGLVDRQTMLATLAAIGVAALGDAVHLVAELIAPGNAELAHLIALIIIAVGSLLTVLALGAMLLDTLRLWPVLAHPPITMTELTQGSD